MDIKNKSKPSLVMRILAVVVAVLLACTPAIAMADMVGIDVSGWQASNVTCTASYDFAVVKVSQGVGFENSSWRTQAKCVTDRGKSLGLYHYAGGNNAEAEADYFVGRARDYIGRAVLVLDWESYQNAQWGNSDWVRRFVQRVHTLTGVWPMVYVQASALGQIPGDVRANCGLWVAQYASNAPTGYQSRPWNYAVYGEAMRQYTSNGWISGYNGPLDLNYFRGDASQWQAYANPAGAAKPATPPQTEKPPTQTIDLQALATATIRGDYGNGQQRRDALGANYDKVMAIVNQRLRGNGGTGNGTGYWVVQRGEYLSLIGARTGVPWTTIAALNGIRSPYVIHPGQKLSLGGANGNSATNTGRRSVVITAGDCLWNHFGADSARVAAANGISNPNLVRAGTVIHY